MNNKEFLKKILVVFGTRPEAIKMSPLVHELKSREIFDVKVCVTGQHREMLDQVLQVFDIIPDYDFSIMKKNQDLFDITTAVMNEMKSLLKTLSPDLVLVHGAFIAALSAFYLQIPVGHVEAGLRTYDMYSPYPEEINRQGIGLMSTLHFAPTESARLNLIGEGKNKDNVYVTGNTVIDALKYTVQKEYSHPLFGWIGANRLILITAHRRENIGEAMRSMFIAINNILEDYNDVKAIYPVHLNPKVRELANEIFDGSDKIRLIEPLGVVDFHNFMDKAYMILTDSGGIQEEASSLGKPALVLRETTERPEGIAAGTLKLVGTNTDKVYAACKLLLDDKKEYDKMPKAANPYGNGNASKKIVDIIAEKL